MPKKKITKKLLEKHMSSHYEKKEKIGRSIKELVFGFNDGLVTTTALVVGVAAGTRNINIILLAGIAEMFANSISMGMGEYISMKSQKEVYEKEIKKEKKEIREVPEMEIKEIEQIYRKKGFKGKKLRMVVDQIVSNQKVWLQTMITEELGLSKDKKSPIKTGLIMGVASLIGSLAPLISFVIFDSINSALTATVIFALIAVFVIGSLRSLFTGKFWFKSGLEMTLIATIAILATYTIGTWFHGLI